jgi:hypothetical protein
MKSDGMVKQYSIFAAVLSCLMSLTASVSHAQLQYSFPERTPEQRMHDAKLQKQNEERELATKKLQSDVDRAVRSAVADALRSSREMSLNVEKGHRSSNEDESRKLAEERRRENEKYDAMKAKQDQGHREFFENAKRNSQKTSAPKPSPCGKPGQRNCLATPQ